MYASGPFPVPELLFGKGEMCLIVSIGLRECTKYECEGHLCDGVNEVHRYTGLFEKQRERLSVYDLLMHLLRSLLLLFCF